MKGHIVVLGQVFSRRPGWDIVWWCDEIDVELQYHHERNLWIAVKYGFERGYFVEVDRGIGNEAEDALGKIWRVIWAVKADAPIPYALTEKAAIQGCNCCQCESCVGARCEKCAKYYPSKDGVSLLPSFEGESMMPVEDGNE